MKPAARRNSIGFKILIILHNQLIDSWHMFGTDKIMSFGKGFERYEVRNPSIAKPQTLTNCQDAISLLNGRRRQLRPQAVPAFDKGTNKMPENPSFKGTPSLLNMKQWLYCLGHSVTRLSSKSLVKYVNRNRISTLKA